MTAAGYVPKNHPHQGPPKDYVDDRETPTMFFHALDREFGFTLDAAASHLNHKLPRYCTLEGSFTCFQEHGPEPRQVSEKNGLEIDWTGHRVFNNPPYSDIRPWVEKASRKDADVVVLLLPANRTEQPWWHDFIEPYRDGRASGGPEVRFVRKRLQFLGRDGEGIINRTSEKPPFGNVLVIWRKTP